MTDYPQELIEFLVKKHGGESEVLRDYALEKIADLASMEGTLGDLLEEAEVHGFRPLLERVQLLELAKLINPAREAALSLNRSGVARTRIRLTAEERSDLYERIIAYLKDNPWSQNSDIARAVDVDSKRLGMHLRDLKNEQKLMSVGIRSKMRYAIAGETSKAPKV
jgi:hypothetical protein